MSINICYMNKPIFKWGGDNKTLTSAAFCYLKLGFRSSAKGSNSSETPKSQKTNVSQASKKFSRRLKLTALFRDFSGGWFKHILFKRKGLGVA